MPASSAAPPHAATQYRIRIPDEIAAIYQDQADARGIEVEQLLAERLVNSVEFGAEKPIYFDDDERRELERMLGKNLYSARDTLVLIRNVVSVKIQNLRITIQPGLLARLKTRCLGMKWEQFLEHTIIQQLERYAGMR